MIPNLDLTSILNSSEQMGSLILLFSGYLYLFYLRSNFELKMKSITQIDIVFLAGSFAFLMYLGLAALFIPLSVYSLVSLEDVFLNLSFASFLLVVASSTLIKSRLSIFRKLSHNSLQFEKIAAVAGLVTFIELVYIGGLSLLSSAPEPISSYSVSLIPEFAIVSGLFNLTGIMALGVIGFVTTEIFSIQPSLKEFN